MEEKWHDRSSDNMPIKMLIIRTCGECPFIYYDDTRGDMCGITGLPLFAGLTPPPLCPIDEMNKERIP